MNLDELLSTLESPIVIRPTRRMTQGELESYGISEEHVDEMYC